MAMWKNLKGGLSAATSMPGMTSGSLFCGVHSGQVVEEHVLALDSRPEGLGVALQLPTTTPSTSREDTSGSETAGGAARCPGGKLSPASVTTQAPSDAEEEARHEAASPTSWFMSRRSSGEPEQEAEEAQNPVSSLEAVQEAVQARVSRFLENRRCSRAAPGDASDAAGQSTVSWLLESRGTCRAPAPPEGENGAGKPASPPPKLCSRPVHAGDAEMGLAALLPHWVMCGPTGQFPQRCAQVAEVEPTTEVEMERMMRELFRLQDLNSNGHLEELELIQLNKKIAVLHYGKSVDKAALAEKYRELFRTRLDPAGEPVPYSVFRRYMRQVLAEMEPGDETAQVMILEQFVSEATVARKLFRAPSLESEADAPFLPSLPLPEEVKIQQSPRRKAEEEAPLLESEQDAGDGGHETLPLSGRVGPGESEQASPSLSTHALLPALGPACCLPWPREPMWHELW